MTSPARSAAAWAAALRRVRAVTGAVAVNVHHGRGQFEAHLDGAGVHLSIEVDEALGTAGALVERGVRALVL